MSGRRGGDKCRTHPLFPERVVCGRERDSLTSARYENQSAFSSPLLYHPMLTIRHDLPARLGGGVNVEDGVPGPRC